MKQVIKLLSVIPYLILLAFQSDASITSKILSNTLTSPGCNHDSNSPDCKANQKGAIITLYTDIGSSWLEFDGYIYEPNLKSLVQYYGMYKPNYVILQSDGGSAILGMSYAGWARKNNVKFIIPKKNYCVSSCAYMFLGSPNGELEGLLGFHQTRIMKSNVYINKVEHAQLTVSINAEDMRFLSEFGWGFQLAYDIYRYSAMDRFVSFTSMNQMAVYKTSLDKVIAWPLLIVNHQNLAAPFRLYGSKYIQEHYPGHQINN